MDQTAASVVVPVAAPEKLPRRHRTVQPSAGVALDTEYLIAVQRVYDWMLSHDWGDAGEDGRPSSQ